MTTADRAAGRVVAFLGPHGTFTEAALRQLPDVGSDRPETSVSSAIDAVRRGTADAAVVPLENSVEGAVPATLDELARGSAVTIECEIYVDVSFVLAVRPGTTLDRVGSVATHPHAEAQCRRWLAEHLPCVRVELTSSTAAGATGVAAGKYDAAVCAQVAAESAGLNVLGSDIGDNKGAVTRFICVTRPAPPPPPSRTDRTSVVAYIRENHTGALLEILTEFAIRGINLTRIESRPTRAQMGEYCFAIDAEGHIADARVGEALAALHRICLDLRYLGSYPRGDGSVGVAAPAGRSDADFSAASAWLDSLRRTGNG
ncbi:MAG: prephenate dehydratase [Mycobacteriales bacterium]